MLGPIPTTRLLRKNLDGVPEEQLSPRIAPRIQYCRIATLTRVQGKLLSLSKVRNEAKVAYDNEGTFEVTGVRMLFEDIDGLHICKSRILTRPKSNIL